VSSYDAPDGGRPSVIPRYATEHLCIYGLMIAFKIYLNINSKMFLLLQLYSC